MNWPNRSQVSEEVKTSVRQNGHEHVTFGGFRQSVQDGAAHVGKIPQRQAKNKQDEVLATVILTSRSRSAWSCGGNWWQRGLHRRTLFLCHGQCQIGM